MCPSFSSPPYRPSWFPFSDCLISPIPFSFPLPSPPLLLLHLTLCPPPAFLLVLQVLLSFGDKPQARHNADSGTPGAIKVGPPAQVLTRVGAEQTGLVPFQSASTPQVHHTHVSPCSCQSTFLKMSSCQRRHRPRCVRACVRVYFYISICFSVLLYLSTVHVSSPHTAYTYVAVAQGVVMVPALLAGGCVNR